MCRASVELTYVKIIGLNSLESPARKTIMSARHQKGLYGRVVRSQTQGSFKRKERKKSPERNNLTAAVNQSLQQRTLWWLADKFPMVSSRTSQGLKFKLNKRRF